MGETPSEGFSATTDATLSREARRFLAVNPTIHINPLRLEELVQERALTRTAWRLLFEIVVRVGPGNVFDETMRDLALHIGADYGCLRMAWRQLVDRGLLTPETNVFGRVVGHRLSPALAWRGRPWKADIAARQFAAGQTLAALANEVAHD